MAHWSLFVFVWIIGSHYVFVYFGFGFDVSVSLNKTLEPC